MTGTEGSGGGEPARAPGGSGAPTGGPLLLDEEEAELVTVEAEAAARVLPEPRRSEAARIAEAARRGEVPAALGAALGELLEASLAGGRARRLHLAEGERVLTGVLRRTPVGRALAERLEELNEALGALVGRRLEAVAAGMRTAGHYTLTIRCDGVGVTLAVGPRGVELEHLSA
ncbi:MAG TPA: hypothetical protein VKV23_03900 [Acidimicrobiales bacterium]|nr:hypothetical protein [Acidimicrobiales bacterium]